MIFRIFHRVRVFAGMAAAIMLAVCATTARAQYFDSGQDPFSIRWRQINNDRYKIIYPSDYEADAQKVAAILDSVRRAVTFGFSVTPRKIPIVMHSENIQSNGMVVWAPKRAELVSAPPRQTYAWPWLEQLTIHEYRHVVQMSNLRQGTLKWLSYIIGEQAIGVGAILLPTWFLEGDAVIAETRMAPFGRGLQPEFTLEYRAYLADSTASQFPIDKWFCGSYRDFIPNHYQLGYQLTDLSYKRYGNEVWDKVARYSARYPFLIVPKTIALHKYYRTSSTKLFRGAFSELHDYWKSLPETQNSTTEIHTPRTSYTKYQYPTAANDTTVIALKYDFDLATRFVSINPATGRERHLAYTGSVTSRPVISNNRLIWTELRQSTLWEQRNFSVICAMQLDGSSNKITTHRRTENLFYITPIEKDFAALSYNTAGFYELLALDENFKETRRTRLSDDVTVHGMAWDAKTLTLGMITLGNRGMSLSACNPLTGALSPLTRPSYVTINNLTAGDGKFFYNSIVSGRDETHFFEITARNEFRATTSRFGSVQPSLSADGKTIFQTTYRREGFFVSKQNIDDAPLEKTEYTRLPKNLVNPPHSEWNLPVIDSVSVQSEKPSKKYRKGGNLINIHSWAPLSYDPFEIADERNLNIGVGATLMSQNVLSNTVGYASYGLVNGKSLVKGKLVYYGFAPKFEINAEYGGGNRMVYAVTLDSAERANLKLPADWKKPYFSVGGRIFLPLNLSSGYMLRRLTPEISLTHYNSMLYDPRNKTFRESYRKAQASIGYSQNVRAAYRDLAPRWGFGARATVAGDPFSTSLGTLYSLSGTVYTPGVLQHHSLKLRGAVQYQDEAVYSFSDNVLFPVGCTYDFSPKRLWAATASYRFPVAYPDGGITEWLYFKRISAGMFFGYSRFQPIYSYYYRGGYRSVNSYGAEIIVDVNPLRMTNGNAQVTFSVFKPSDSKNVGFSIGLSIYN